MSKGRPARIGLFIMVAMGLLIAGILFFGGTRWFEPSSKAVLYFDESVDGLSVGSDVNFRGVRVGEVERLRLELDAETAEAVVVVTIRLTPGDRFGGGAELSDSDESFNLQYWIDQGLVGQLNATSLLTGQLSIQLNFDRDSSAVTLDRDSDFPQIPVVRSEIEQVRDAITEVDWRGLIERFDATMVGIKDLTDTLQTELGGVGDNIQSTAEGTEALVQEVRDTLARSQEVIERLADQIETTLVSSQGVIERLGNQTETTLASFSTLSEDASNTLADFSALSRRSDTAIEDLSRQIDRTLVSVERLSDTAGDALDGRGEELSRVINETERTLASFSRVAEQLESMTDPRSQERDDLQRTLRDLASASASIQRIADMLERNPQSLFFGNEGDRR